MPRSAIPQALRRAVVIRDQGVCGYCRLSQIGQGAVFHIDHIVPKSRGGATELRNLVLQCPHCSLHKSNRTDGLDSTTGRNVSLFHPLTETWSEHFSHELDGGIVGLTDKGRATVVALQMNDVLPKLARALQRTSFSDE